MAVGVGSGWEWEWEWELAGCRWSGQSAVCVACCYRHTSLRLRYVSTKHCCCCCRRRRRRRCSGIKAMGNEQAVCVVVVVVLAFGDVLYSSTRSVVVAVTGGVVGNQVIKIMNTVDTCCALDDLRRASLQLCHCSVAGSLSSLFAGCRSSWWSLLSSLSLLLHFRQPGVKAMAVHCSVVRVWLCC